MPNSDFEEVVVDIEEAARVPDKSEFDPFGWKKARPRLRDNIGGLLAFLFIPLTIILLCIFVNLGIFDRWTHLFVD